MALAIIPNIERLRRVCERVSTVADVIGIVKTAYDDNQKVIPVKQNHHSTENYTLVFPLPSVSIMNQPSSYLTQVSIPTPVPISTVNKSTGPVSDNKIQTLADMHRQSMQKNIAIGKADTAKREQNWNQFQTFSRQAAATCSFDTHQAYEERITAAQNRPLW
jgi:hypothetical protein